MQVPNACLRGKLRHPECGQAQYTCCCLRLRFSPACAIRPGVPGGVAHEAGYRVALKLVRDGRLDLRAPVSRYLPDGYPHRKNPFRRPNDDQLDLVPASTLARIPVATLLNHSSGLPNWTSGALVPEFMPGERWQYSGEGYVLLQAIISAVTGQDIESVVSK